MKFKKVKPQYILPVPDRARRFRWLAVCVIVGISVYGIFLGLGAWMAKRPTPIALPVLLKERIASALERSIHNSEFPRELDVAFGDTTTKTGVIYTVDWKAQSFMEKMFQSYRPDFGSFVAMDANTGRVLALVSFNRNATDLGHIALKATFPAASVFKIVTAAAAIDRGKAKPGTSIAYNGGNHTLYKRNVTDVSQNRWTRHVTLSEAFAKSINTVFAKVGLYMLEPSDLPEYAGRFQFNQSIPADLPVERSRFEMDAGDQWAVAEAASGFNRIATLSPLQGALMAAAVANDGVMMAPYIVERLYSAEKGILYHAEPDKMSVTVSPESAQALRTLMRETVRIGTSRSVFRHLLNKRGFTDVEIGGKTGSLAGFTPKGKYDWFVGYARRGNKRIAVSALTINEEKWQVKSSYLARSFFEHYFSDKAQAE